MRPVVWPPPGPLKGFVPKSSPATFSIDTLSLPTRGVGGSVRRSHWADVSRGDCPAGGTQSSSRAATGRVLGRQRWRSEQRPPRLVLRATSSCSGCALLRSLSWRLGPGAPSGSSAGLFPAAPSLSGRWRRALDSRLPVLMTSQVFQKEHRSHGGSCQPPDPLFGRQRLSPFKNMYNSYMVEGICLLAFDMKISSFYTARGLAI